MLCSNYEIKKCAWRKFKHAIHGQFEKMYTSIYHNYYALDSWFTPHVYIYVLTIENLLKYELVNKPLFIFSTTGGQVVWRCPPAVCTVITGLL